MVTVVPIYPHPHPPLLRSHGEAGVEPAGGAVPGLQTLTQAGPRGADLFAGTLAGEDSLVQTAGGQDVFFIQPAEGQAEFSTRGAGGERLSERGMSREKEWLPRTTEDAHKLSPKFMGSRKPVRPSSFPLRIWERRERRFTSKSLQVSGKD